MKKVNSIVFGRDATTDVISMPIMEKINLDKSKDIELCGEIVVNHDQVVRNAKEYEVSYEQELARVVAHGVLHIMGYTDDTEKARSAMKAIEDAVVSTVPEGTMVSNLDGK